MDRRNEDEWLDDTEPYHGARPRIMQEQRSTMDVNQLVDSVLGATMCTTGQDIDVHDTPAPTLPPEQQIRQEGEIRTPPRWEPRRDGGHRLKGLQLPMGGTALAPGEPFSKNSKAASGSAPCTTGSAYDDQSILVQWIDQLRTVSTSV